MLSARDASRERGAWAWWLLMLVALGVGVFLRYWQLRSQMLIDDEWHSVRMLMRADAHGIASHFGLADYCIPLTLYYRWLYEHAALDEWSMHVPLLLAGIALLFIAPALLRHRVSLPTRAIWTGLLAISPALVYYSRTARPYALLALLGVVALVAFRNWHERREDRRQWAFVYVVATLLSGWLHLLSLVFTLWPFAYYGVGALLACRRTQTRAQAQRALAAMLVLGTITLIALVLVLAAPLNNDWAAMSGKAGADSVSMASLYRTVLMELGIANAVLCLVVVALFVLGIWRLWQHDREFVGLTLGASLVGTIVICAARPAWIQHAQVLVRYGAPVLPFLLLFVAAGATAVLERVRLPVVAVMIAFCALGGLFMAGPMPDYLYAPNQFMAHEVFQFDYDARENPYATLLKLGPVSPFYRELAQRPPASVTLIETPQRAQSNYMPDPWLQQIHKQNVKYALASPVCGIGDWDEFPYDASNANFRRMGKLADILDGATYGANYLVLRLQPWTLPAAPDFPWPVAWPDMPACVAKVTARLGEPSYRDDQIVVFALADKHAREEH
ncbi:MAG: hypothetical protein ABIO49_04395 [Dokdonella sp.]